MSSAVEVESLRVQMLRCAVKGCCLFRRGRHHAAMGISSARHTRGATIVELVVCLSIVAVVVAVAVPRYAVWRDRVGAREAASDVVGVLGDARETAVLRAGFVAVVLDTLRGSMESRAGGATLTRHDETARYGVALAANRDSVVYDPRGLGYGASTVSIMVRRGAAAETITVSRMGRVHW